jgi:hypothetical protein
LQFITVSDLKNKEPLKSLSSMAPGCKPNGGERRHNYVGAPEIRIIRSIEHVLTPQAEDINLVLGLGGRTLTVF